MNSIFFLILFSAFLKYKTKNMFKSKTCLRCREAHGDSSDPTPSAHDDNRERRRRQNTGLLFRRRSYDMVCALRVTRPALHILFISTAASSSSSGVYRVPDSAAAGDRAGAAVGPAASYTRGMGQTVTRRD
uniref:Uncharacterized protein n=1 Tax=Knipowitschia caucasica TaxID=637954 RepID=A0AAV2LUU9_KNICA